MAEAVNSESLYRFLIDYTEAGFSLVPLVLSGEKKKPVPGWGGWQYRDHREALRYLEQKPGNVGIITGKRSRLVVLDYDNAEAGLAFSEAYYDRTGARPTTIQSGGKRGGLHYYFSLREGERVNGRVIRQGGEKVGELIAEGGLVMAPPSLHPVTGGEYRFCVGLENLSPWGPEAESLSGVEPEPVAGKQLGIPGIADKRGLACVGEIKSRELVEGEREKTLWMLYWLCRSNGDKASYAERQVRELNSRARPPLPEAEIRGIFKGRKSYKFSCAKIRAELKINLAVCENCRFHARGGLKLIGAKEMATVLSPEVRGGTAVKVWLGVKAGELDLSNKAEVGRMLGVTPKAIGEAVRNLQEAGIIL